MICEKHKIIFIHIPKTAGTTIESIFKSSRLDIWNTKYRLWEQHSTISQLIKMHKVDINQYYKFTVIRNPWDRAVSGYNWWTQSKSKLFKGVKNTTLKDYLLIQNGFEKVNHRNDNTSRADHFCTQYSFLEIDGVDTMDYIIKFENLRDDFNIVCDKIGIPQQQLPHANKSKHKHYTEYYDDETKQIVAEKYAKDIEYFGYEFGQ